MAQMTLALCRLRRARQIPRRFGPRYKAAQMATTKEAPPGSRPQELRFSPLQRAIQTLSVAEGHAARVALHHPRLFELWDQHMLNPWPEQHPLSWHPKGHRFDWPSTTGTVEIAERLGCLKSHPSLWDEKRQVFEPIALLGDFLLFLLDEDGPYCIEWDCKREEGDHGKPHGDKKKHGLEAEMKRAALKDQLRLEYLKELAIPMVRISLASFDAMLLENLDFLFPYQWTCSSLAETLQADIIETAREGLLQAFPPHITIAAFVAQGVHPDAVLEVLWQAVWFRKLQVDLFQKVRADLPLCPQVRDPFGVYSQLFSRRSRDAQASTS